MITIFCDFCQISAKKLEFFSKTNVMITIFAKTSFVLSQKRQFFRWIFRRKVLQNHNIGPRSVEQFSIRSTTVVRRLLCRTFCWLLRVTTGKWPPTPFDIRKSWNEWFAVLYKPATWRNTFLKIGRCSLIPMRDQNVVVNLHFGHTTIWMGYN
jgi:hypothetical protein